MACHRLTLVNSWANRLEVKKRKYVQLHAALASAVEKYEETEDKLAYFKKTCQFTIITLSKK